MITKRETALRAIEKGKPKLDQWSKELLADDELVIAGMKADEEFRSGSEWYSDYFLRFISESALLEAVRINGLALRRLPLEMWDEEICLAAVKANGKALYFIRMRCGVFDKSPYCKPDLPEDFVTDEMYRAALESGRFYPMAFPDEYLTEDVHLTYIANGGILENVKPEYRTARVCREALKRNPKAVKHIPVDLMIDALGALAEAEAIGK